MEEDIDEVLLRLTNTSVMNDKSNAKYNLTSTNNVVDLESESDDCCTSISQRAENPLSVLGTSASRSLPLPTAKMLTSDRFWQGQAESLAIDNKDDFTELSSSSVGTFSVETKKRDPVTFSQWYPILHNRKLQITGVTVDGSDDSRYIDRRVSGYIFYDNSQVVCSLGGPMTHFNSQPKFIQQKFNLGIPEDWVQVQSIWNAFEKHGSPENFAWLSSTDIDTSDLNNTGYDQSVIPSTRLAISTPRNNTAEFYNMTTDISKINASHGQRTYAQKLLHNTVNSTANRSMKRTYTSAALKKKMNKIRSMLKVTLMRECSKLTSFNELVELDDDDSDMRTCNVEVPVDNGVPLPKTIASDRNNQYLLQNMLSEHLVFKDLSKNNVNLPTTSQSQNIELAEPENSLQNEVVDNNTNADSLKTTTNVFLNKSQFLSINKSCNAVKDISSSSKNSGKTKLAVADTNKTTITNVSQKFREYVSQKDKLCSEMSESCVSANQSSKTNSSEKRVVKNSAVLKASANNSKNGTPAASSSDDLNYVPSNIMMKHRNSLTLLLNKNGITRKSVSDNSSEMDNLDLYPSKSDSVVISFHNIDQRDVTSDVNTEHTAKNSSSVVENVSRSLKNSITDNVHNDKVVQSEEHHLESSYEDSIFSNKSKVPANVDNSHHDQLNNMRNQKVIRHKLLFSSESSDDDDDQNANQMNKAANTNVEISNSDKHLNLATKTIEEKTSTSNSESSDDGSVNSIIVQSSNVKIKLGSESSDNSQESNVIIVTDAVVHSSAEGSVKSGQESPTLQEQHNSNINKSGTRMNRKTIVQKTTELYTNDDLEIISSVKELTDDKSANRSNNKVKSPEQNNRDNSSLKRKGKKNTKGNKSHGEDAATNQIIMQEDSLMQFTEETIQEQTLPDPKQTPKSSKGRNNAKRAKDTIQKQRSNSTNLTLEFDLSLNNTTFSRQGRARCPTLQFWMGARFVTIGNETMISTPNLSNKAVENKKRILTPQKQTTVPKKARTKPPQKSSAKVLNTELTVLSAASSAGTEEHSKNIANIRTPTPKNTKNVRSASKSKTAKSRAKTKNTNLNILSCSSNDTKSNNFIDSVQSRYPIRNSRSPSHSPSKYSKINENAVTEVPSSEISTSVISTNEKQSPVKLSRSVSKKNIKKLLHEDNARAKCSPKSKEAKKTIILNKVSTNITPNISITKENGKHVLSRMKSKTKDIYRNSPLQREASINMKLVDNFTPIKSNKKIKLSSQDSGVEISNTDDLMEHTSMPGHKRNAKLNNNTTLQMARMNTEIDIDNVEPAVEANSGTMQKENTNVQTESIRNKNETDGRSRKRNAKTKEEKFRRQKGNSKSSTLNTNNHTQDTCTVNLIKLEVQSRKNKKKHQKHEVNVQDVTMKQLRSRDISSEMTSDTPNSHGSSCVTNLKPQASVEPRTKRSTSKSSKLNSPKKLIKTSKRETHEMVAPELPAKKSRGTRDPNKRQLRSDSVSLLSTKQNCVEQSIAEKGKTLKNNEKNSATNELTASEAPVRKSKKLKQNTTQDKNLTWNNADCVSSLPNRSKRSKNYNMTDGRIDCNFSESHSQKTGKHKTNPTQTLDHPYDAYVNNKCVALVTPLSTEEIEKFTKHKSSERLVQSAMNDQESKSVNQTINGKMAAHAVEKNVSSLAKAKCRSSSKKPRKQKSFGETYFGDPVRMPLLIKLKRKRQPKEKLSINTTDLAADSSINSTNNVTRKAGKRKFFNDTDWLNSQECLQTFGEIAEPCRSQNFCLQLEKNIAEPDYFDDDISEVSALAK